MLFQFPTTSGTTTTRRRITSHLWRCVAVREGRILLVVRYKRHIRHNHQQHHECRNESGCCCGLFPMVDDDVLWKSPYTRYGVFTTSCTSTSLSPILFHSCQVRTSNNSVIVKTKRKNVFVSRRVYLFCVPRRDSTTLGLATLLLIRPCHLSLAVDGSLSNQ